MVRVMEVFRGDSGPLLGEFLRGRRRVAGWTQRGLADAAGLSVGVVRDLEQGVSARLRRDSLERLAAVLGVAPEEAAGAGRLFGGARVPAVPRARGTGCGERRGRGDQA